MKQTNVDKQAVLDCVNFMWDRLIKDGDGKKTAADLTAECLSITISLLSNVWESLSGVGPEQSYEMARRTCIEFLSQENSTVEHEVNQRAVQ